MNAAEKILKEDLEQVKVLKKKRLQLELVI